MILICNRCGTKFNSPCCPNCGSSAQNINNICQQPSRPPNANNVPYQQNPFLQQQPNQFRPNGHGAICPRCGCPNVIHSTTERV